MQYTRVYQRVLHLLQDETFGFAGSELTAPGAFRMMCYCIISCRNLGQAIQRAAEFYRTFFDERSQLYANFSEQYARVGYRTVDRGGDPRNVLADAYGLSLWHRFFGWLCGRPIELKRVDFSGVAPARIEKYEACSAARFTSARPTTCCISIAPAWPGRWCTRSTPCGSFCAPRPTSC